MKKLEETGEKRKIFNVQAKMGFFSLDKPEYSHSKCIIFWARTLSWVVLQQRGNRDTSSFIAVFAETSIISETS